jgi:hypothetical protein
MFIVQASEPTIKNYDHNMFIVQATGCMELKLIPFPMVFPTENRQHNVVGRYFGLNVISLVSVGINVKAPPVTHPWPQTQKGVLTKIGATTISTMAIRRRTA